MKSFPSISFLVALPLPMFCPLLHGQEAPPLPVRRAVVVGVDAYKDAGTFMPLQGCGNDAKAMAKSLKEKFGFKEEEVVVLTDTEVTLPKLRETLKKHLVDELPADGVGVFYYAGHGVQVPDLNGDETDGMDEALVLHDTEELNPGSYLVDDEIGEILTSVKTANMLVLFDTCHSGTVNRTSGQYAEFRTTKIAWPETSQASRSGGSGFSMKAGEGHVVLAACQPDEVANELREKDFPRLGKEGGTEACGLFTWCFREWLDGGVGVDKPLAEATKALDGLVSKVIRDTGKTYPQKPWFSLGGRDGVSLSKLLSGKAGTPGPAGDEEAVNPPAPAPELTFTPEGVAQEGAIKLDLKLNQRVFKDGEKLVIEATAEEDSHIRLYYMNAKGEVTQLFPNEHHKDNFLPKGRTVRIPGTASGFDLVMGAPYGVEALKLVASNKQFTDLQNEKWAQGLFQQVDIASLQEMSFRGIDARQGDTKYGNATVFYKVLDPAPPATEQAPAGEGPTQPGKPE